MASAKHRSRSSDAEAAGKGRLRPTTLESGRLFLIEDRQARGVEKRFGLYYQGR